MKIKPHLKQLDFYPIEDNSIKNEQHEQYDGLVRTVASFVEFDEVSMNPDGDYTFTKVTIKSTLGELGKGDTYHKLVVCPDSMLFKFYITSSMAMHYRLVCKSSC